MTDRLRILAALEQGTVSPVDFAAPNVIDGGKPVMRVAARVKELRDAGYTIRSSRAANGIALYTLEATPESDAAPTGTPEMAAPSVAAAQQAPADAVAPPAAVAPLPHPCDHASDLLGSTLFETDKFRSTHPHWKAA